jgi:hypothetical protein
MPRAIDITGQRFGKLVALNFQEHRYSISGESKRFWRCKCDCGNECVVDVGLLRQGNIKSCGCYKVEVNKGQIKHLTHGHSKTRIYKIWVDMKRRCNKTTRKDYEHYGGRGITFCPEWENFEPFYEWSMANGYRDDLTLDRINNDENYEPSNCRWVNFKAQANNTSRNHHLTYKGETKNISQWAEEYGLSYGLLRDRIVVLGWDVEKALTTPVKKVKKEK